MPVSGLVVSLCDEPKLRAQTLDLIEREPRIITGALESNRLAIVTDTESSQEDRQLWNWLDSLSAVLLIQVAFVGFEQHEDTNSFPVSASKDDVHDGC